MTDLDDQLFKALNSVPKFTAPAELSPDLYGDYEVDSDRIWSHSYKDITGVKGQYEHEDGKMHSLFHLAYDRWQPRGVLNTSKLPIVILAHGVPVNRTEWYGVARILARFCIVYTVDLLGMGWSSKPLSFPWKRSWDIQAHLFVEFLNGKGFHESPRFRFELRSTAHSVFLSGNDWGGGVVQRAVNLIKNRGITKVKGFILGSTIALNGYWVQQIGALSSLATMPFKDENGDILLSFKLQAQAFVGSLTTLLETMHHRTSEILNQYSLAPLQAPFVDVSAYFTVDSNPSNTTYHYHAIRVLAEQANLALGNGLLLPYHRTQNTNGIKFSEWDTPLLVFWGMRDKMMPAGQTHRFSNISHAVRQANTGSRFWVDTAVFENAGHFAASDQPKLTADAILNFISNVIGPESLQHAYFGLYEIARQDEWHLLHAFEEIYGQNVRIISEDEQQEIQCEHCGEQATHELWIADTIHKVCNKSCATKLWESLGQEQ